jgi:hypothetical protein
MDFYFNCKGNMSTSVLPLYIILALPNDGCNYQPKRAVVSVMNK